MSTYGAYQKTTGGANWNAGFSSTIGLPAQDANGAGNGYMSFQAPSDINNTIMMVGLSYSDPDQNYTSINYAIYLYQGTVYIYESGTKFNYANPIGYIANDTFSIYRINTTVFYMKNNSIFATSAVPATGAPMIADASFYNVGDYFVTFGGWVAFYVQATGTLNNPATLNSVLADFTNVVNMVGVNSLILCSPLTLLGTNTNWSSPSVPLVQPQTYAFDASNNGGQISVATYNVTTTATTKVPIGYYNLSILGSIIQKTGGSASTWDSFAVGNTSYS